MTSMRGHRTARLAFQRVKARSSEQGAKEYASLAYKLPSMVLQNGLAQSTGFLLAKAANTPAHRQLHEDLLHVLQGVEASSAPNFEAFHEEVLATDLQQCILLTRRTLEVGAWLKRYAQALIGIGENSSAPGTSAQGGSRDA